PDLPGPAPALRGVSRQRPLSENRRSTRHPPRRPRRFSFRLTAHGLRLTKVRAYLSGAIEHAADGGRGWREELSRLLRDELGHEVYDPAADEKKSLTEEELANFRRWKLDEAARFREKRS